MMLSRFAMFFGGSRDDREGSNPVALLATDHPGADCGAVDSGGCLALARVRRRRRRSQDRRRSDGTRQRARKDRGGIEGRSAGCESSDSPHVYREAVFRGRSARTLQHPPTDRETHRSAAPSVARLRPGSGRAPHHLTPPAWLRRPELRGAAPQAQPPVARRRNDPEAHGPSPSLLSGKLPARVSSRTAARISAASPETHG